MSILMGTKGICSDFGQWRSSNSRSCLHSSTEAQTAYDAAKFKADRQLNDLLDKWCEFILIRQEYEEADAQISFSDPANSRFSS